MIKKIRGKTLSLISASSGNPKIIIAQKSSTCSRCKKAIIKQEKCSEISKNGGAFVKKSRYCIDCLKEIIKQTKIEIKKIEDELQ